MNPPDAAPPRPGDGRPLNILLALHATFLCGEIINAIEVAALLRSRGHGVALFYFSESAEPVREASGVLRLPPTLALAAERRLPVVTSRWPRGSSAGTLLWRLSCLIRVRQIDVVHVFGDTALTRWVTLGAGMAGVPIVVNDYKMDISPTHPRRVPLIVGTHRLLEEARSSRPGACVLVEPPVDAVENAPSAADGTVFREAHGIAQAETLLVIVGRIDGRMKLPGILGAIESMAHLDDRNIRLIIVGEGEGQQTARARAEAMNQRLGRQAVQVADAMPDPRPAYAAADIVLGMGHSALRAAAFAKPVIVLGEGTFSLPLTPETLTHFSYEGFFGYSEGADFGAQLAEQLRPLIRDRAERDRLGDFGRRLVLQRYSIDVAVDRLEATYREAIRTRSWSAWFLDAGHVSARRASRALREAPRRVLATVGRMGSERSRTSRRA